MFFPSHGKGHVAMKDVLTEESKQQMGEVEGDGRREGEGREVGGRDKRWVSYQLSLGWQQDRGQGLNQLCSRDRPTPDKHPADPRHPMPPYTSCQRPA